jgi:hypothetical protein
MYAPHWENFAPSWEKCSPCVKENQPHIGRSNEVIRIPSGSRDVAILVNSINNGDLLSCVVISSHVSLCMLYFHNYVLLNALSNGL